MVDQAGNYIFELDGEKYRVMKMNVFQQREYLGVIKDAFFVDFDGNSTLNFYSVACNNAQDWLLPRIYHNISGAYKALNSEYMDEYLAYIEKEKGVKPITTINSIFVKGVDALLENFTGSGQAKPQVNLDPNADEDLQVDNTPNLLSKTLPK